MISYLNLCRRHVMLYTVLIVAMVAIDQIVKYWVRANIELYQVLPFIPKVLGLSYIQNTGAAWSILSEHTWLLTLISAVVSVALAVMLYKNYLTRHPIGKTCLALVLAGAIGNLIDRALMGYVTDMFRTLFMDFPVFNVADICVVCGAFGLCFYVGFFYDKLEGKDGTHSSAD